MVCDKALFTSYEHTNINARITGVGGATTLRPQGTGTISLFVNGHYFAFPSFDETSIYELVRMALKSYLLAPLTTSFSSVPVIEITQF